MKIDIGAGARVSEGWTSVDLNPTADVVADVLHLPFADGSVDEMRAVDVLEHLSYRDTTAGLAEWARVCKRGAEAYIQVPDAETIMRWFVAGDPGLKCKDTGPCSALEGAEWRLLGGHADGVYVDETADWRWNAHYSLWSHDSLRTALDRAGFGVVRLERNDHPNLLAWATI